MAIDKNGTLYVSDFGSQRILEVTQHGKKVRTLSGNGTAGYRDGAGKEAQFHSPTGIAMDAAGNLHVADADNHCIRKITPEGETTAFAGSCSNEGFDTGTTSTARFNRPKGVVFDAAGSLYMADQENHRIRRITPEGQVTTFAGNGKAGFADSDAANAAQFNKPSGLAFVVDESGSHGILYVADENNHRIRKIVLE
jgi:DNA-binding beta-propeller fold protein YncE